jgi:hypothetical protein
MIREAILQDDLSIPASNDFVVGFGCDVEFDEQTYTELYTFVDELNQTLKMCIGTADRTFSLSIVRNEVEIVRVYDECLSCVSLDENRKIIVIILGKDRCTQKLELSVWPRVTATFTRMR